MSKHSNSIKGQKNTQTKYAHLQTDLQGELIEQHRLIHEKTLIRLMDEEIEDLGYTRNGYRKPRAYHTFFGTIWLKIPRVVEGNYLPSFLIRNSAFDPHLIFAIQSMYLGGMSQRKIAEHLNDVFYLDGVTKRQVQTVIKQIIEPSQQFLNRDLSSCYYPAIFVDSHGTPIREAGKVSKKSIMLAIGVKPDGSREVLGMDIQTSEAASNYRMFFQKLKERGLKSPEVIVSDDHKGLKLAIQESFPLSCWRRCNFHLLQTAGKLSNFDQKFLSELSEALLQENPIRIVHDCYSVIFKYEKAHSEATKLVEESLVDLMNFNPCDNFAALTATNNFSESLNSYIRLRTDSVRVFPHSEAYTRLVGNLLIERSNKWNQEKRLEESTEKRLLKRKDNYLKEVKEILGNDLVRLETNIISPCILWFGELFKNVSLTQVNLSLGTVIAYGCDTTGYREPISLGYILKSRKETVQKLISLLKCSFNLENLFLIVVPVSMQPYLELFKESFPGVSFQLDTNSFTEMLANIVPKKERKDFQDDLKELYQAVSKREFRILKDEFLKNYSSRFPRATEIFEKNFQLTASYLKFDLPRGRINNIKDLTKSLKERLDQELSSITNIYLPYPKLEDYKNLLLKSLDSEIESRKTKAYISAKRLSYYC